MSEELEDGKISPDMTKAQAYAETRAALDALLADPNAEIPHWLTRDQAIEDLRAQLRGLDGPVKNVATLSVG